MVGSTGFLACIRKVTHMSLFNLSDRQSSTVLLSSDSLDEVFAAVQSIVSDDGPSGLDGLSLSVQDSQSGEYDDFDDAEVLKTLQARHVREHAILP